MTAPVCSWALPFGGHDTKIGTSVFEKLGIELVGRFEQWPTVVNRVGAIRQPFFAVGSDECVSRLASVVHGGTKPAERKGAQRGIVGALDQLVKVSHIDFLRTS